MRLILKGAQPYWFHPGLVAVIAERTGWGEKQCRDFIAKSEFINFNGIHPKNAKSILEKLETQGFHVQLEQVKGDYTAVIALGYADELAAVKKEMADLNQRIAALESLKGSAPAGGLKASAAFSTLADEAEKAPEPQAVPAAKAPELSRGTSESNIGRFWLSRIGVVSLVLGVVFLIGYSIQSISAFGKIMMGLILGAGMIAAGNAIASREKDRAWAMGILGGGWALVYFTVFASYSIPLTRIIQSPLVGLVLLLAVAVGAITQSLFFNSAVLVTFSYFLAYVALTTVTPGLYTLMASFILACSLVIVLRRKQQWTPLGLLAFAGVYLIHYLWLEPGIMQVGSFDRRGLWDLFVLPWAGESWSLYPIITGEQSFLHQGFLILYWLLFASLGAFKKLNSKDDEIFIFVLLAGNSFLFTGLYLDHLHAYYPAIKYMFPLVMSAVYGFLFEVERRQQRRLFADLYLTFSVTLLCLVIPMMFDGAVLSYGWSAASALLIRLGLKYGRRILQIIGFVLSVIVLYRVLFIDYALQNEIFRLILPVRECFFVYLAAGVSFFLTLRALAGDKTLAVKTRSRLETLFLAASMLMFGNSVLMGGPRTAATAAWIAAAALLIIWGRKGGGKRATVTGLVFVFLGVLRLSAVDFGIDLEDCAGNLRAAARLAVSGLAVLGVLALADWLRRKAGTLTNLEARAANIMTGVGAFLVLTYFYDSQLGSWVSIIWGVTGFAFLAAGFVLKDKTYRWCGLGIFAIVILRLFLHDFSHLETIYRIISFIGLGGVLIGASVLYNRYSKIFLAGE